MVIDELHRAIRLRNTLEQSPAPFMSILDKAIHVDIQNVANYVDSLNVYKLDLERSFPKITPPWPAVWMEWTKKGIGRGVLLETQEIKRDADVRWILTFLHFKTNLMSRPEDFFGSPFFAIDSILVGHNGEFCFGDEDYVLRLGKKFFSSPDREVIFQEKPFLSKRATPHISGFPIKIMKNEAAILEVRDMMSAFVARVLMAICFCHCKNVSLKNETANRACRKQRQREKLPEVKHYTLQIQPMIKIVSETNKENSFTNALHICRGHFKDYRDHGLFGQNKEIYWWNMHARGTSEKGIIEKQYNIIPTIP